MKLIQIDPININGIWCYIDDMLQKAIDKNVGEFTLSNIHKLLLSKDMQLWVIVDKGEIQASIVTEIIKYPNKQVAFVVLLAGKNTDWLELTEQLETWAKLEGCQEIRQMGRKGWKPHMQKINWKNIYTVYSKEL